MLPTVVGICSISFQDDTVELIKVNVHFGSPRLKWPNTIGRKAACSLVVLMDSMAVSSLFVVWSW